jgi:hypothetical protein
MCEYVRGGFTGERSVRQGLGGVSREFLLVIVEERGFDMITRSPRWSTGTNRPDRLPPPSCFLLPYWLISFVRTAFHVRRPTPMLCLFCFCASSKPPVTFGSLVVVDETSQIGDSELGPWRLRLQVVVKRINHTMLSQLLASSVFLRSSLAERAQHTLSTFYPRVSSFEPRRYPTRVATI